MVRGRNGYEHVVAGAVMLTASSHAFDTGLMQTDAQSLWPK